MAAAEGTVGKLAAEALWPRTGLKSWLFFLDLPAERVPIDTLDLKDGRIGEPSREALGDVLAEVRPERSGVVKARL